MMYVKKQVLVWELAGIAFICLLGNLLHFTFDWLGRWMPAAAICPVNESVWEHLKMGYWPAVLFSFVEYPFIRRYVNNFLAAKASAIYLPPLLIVVLYYSYTAIIGHHLLAADIIIFILAVAAGQLASYAILLCRKLGTAIQAVSLAAIILLGTAFIIFTFYPIHLSIFRDPANGKYGVW